MAVIKSGDSTTLLRIDPTSMAARVTLYDQSGNAKDFTLNANVSLLAQEAGHLYWIDKTGAVDIRSLLGQLLQEQKITNELLANGLGLAGLGPLESPDSYRGDAMLTKLDVPV